MGSSSNFNSANFYLTSIYLFFSNTFWAVRLTYLPFCPKIFFRSQNAFPKNKQVNRRARPLINKLHYFVYRYLFVKNMLPAVCNLLMSVDRYCSVLVYLLALLSRPLRIASLWAFLFCCLIFS